MIELGLTADTMRQYNLDDAEQHRRTTANPYAPGISSQGAYSALDGWADWTTDDWSSGIGHNRPDDGARDTRATTIFGQRAMLPLAPRMLSQSFLSGYSTTTYEPDHSGTINMGNDYGNRIVLSYGLPTGSPQSYVGIAVRVDPGVAQTQFTRVSLYTNIQQTAIECRIHLDTDGTFLNSTLLGTSTLTPDASIVRPACPQWVTFVFDDNYIDNASNSYWINFCLPVTEAFPDLYYAELELMAGTVTAGQSVASTTFPTTKSTYTNVSFIPLFTVNNSTLVDEPTYSFRRLGAIFNGEYYQSTATSATESRLYKADIANFTAGTSLSGLTNTGLTAFNRASQIMSLVTWGNKLYATYMDNVVISVNTSGTTATEAFTARMLCKHKGYLWRVLTNVIAYTVDGSTWVTAGTIYPTPANGILWMQGFQNRLYISTTYGIFYVEDGDFIQYLTDWGTTGSGLTGRFLTVAGDSLYTLVDDQTIYQIDSGHQILNIIQNQTAFLDKGKTPVAMTSIQGNLCALFKRGTRELPGTDLYIYKTGSWHYLTDVPTTAPGSITWDDENGAIVIASATGQAFIYYMQNLSTSFQYAANARFAKNGWIEYDRNFADKITIIKEWESITTSLELPVDTGFDLYLKHPNNTSQRFKGWVKVAPLIEQATEPTLATYLDRIVEERRIETSTYMGSRSGNWIQLAIRLVTHDPEKTPILDALSLKYLPMVTDRWQWTLNIPIGDNQQFVDGSINPFTAQEQREHLEALTHQETLIYFRDIDGRTYGCKVLSAGDSPTEYDPGADVEAYREHIPYLFQLTIQQFEEIT